MFNLIINYNLQHLITSHIFCILFFTLIYSWLFNNFDIHYYILNNSMYKDDYIKNKMINSLYLSVNIQTTTAYVDFNVKSSIAKLIVLVQQFLSLIITLGYINITYYKII